MGIEVVIGDEFGDFLAAFVVRAPLLLDAQIAKAFCCQPSCAFSFRIRVFSYSSRKGLFGCYPGNKQRISIDILLWDFYYIVDFMRFLRLYNRLKISFITWRVIQQFIVQRNSLDILKISCHEWKKPLIFFNSPPHGCISLFFVIYEFSDKNIIKVNTETNNLRKKEKEKIRLQDVHLEK